MQLPILFALSFFVLTCQCAHIHRTLHENAHEGPAPSALSLASSCAAHTRFSYFTQRIDHFSVRQDQGTFAQRYLLCDEQWQGPGAPIFFYAGNEGRLNPNSTGLMWENAERFGALLLFGEHRFYGQTEPFGKDSWKLDPSTLTVEQALADYAVLIQHVKQDRGAQDSPTIIFGGSYGGELASWMRLKYPHIITGAIAASAPVLGFSGEPGFRPASFWEIVTRDATPAAGAAPGCSRRVKEAFDILIDAAADHNAEARAHISKQLRLCEPLNNKDDVISRAFWLQGAFDAYAMGPWDFQVCSELMQQEQPYWPANGKTDMFWDQGPFDLDAISQHCEAAWGITPDKAWPSVYFGGLKGMKQASNIVFSNGDFDPWSAFGIREDLSDTVRAVLIKEGAHHLDLMWSHPDDPLSVRAAREFEMKQVQRWLQQHAESL